MGARTPERNHQGSQLRRIVILLDTNVISELRPGKRKASPQVRAWAADQPFEQLFLSSVPILELRTGMERKARIDSEQGRRLRDWIEALEAEFGDRILGFSPRAAKLCAPMHSPDPMELRDSMIAAIALEHGLTLATRNVHDFVGRGILVLNPWDSPA